MNNNTLKEDLSPLVRSFYNWGINKQGQSLSIFECKQLEQISLESENLKEFTKEDMYMLAAKVVNDIAKNRVNSDWNFYTTPKMIADDFIENIEYYTKNK